MLQSDFSIAIMAKKCLLVLSLVMGMLSAKPCGRRRANLFDSTTNLFAGGNTNDWDLSADFLYDIYKPGGSLRPIL
jgi:hypothetical protein